jgi:hypothetical protein
MGDKVKNDGPFVGPKYFELENYTSSSQTLAALMIR